MKSAQTLQFISSTVNTTGQRSGIVSTLKTLWQDLVNAIASEPELRIWETSDRFGNRQWHAYDPKRDLSFRCHSEAELKQWIDERYYLKNELWG